MLVTRRTLLIGGGTVLTCAVCGFSEHVLARPRSQIYGCCLQSGEAAMFGASVGREFESALSVSPDNMGETEKRAFGRSLVRISTTLGVRPGFGFFEDGHNKNAYASPETQVAGTWGTVMFGKQLWRDQLTSYDDNGLSVVVICAHEFGHIYQFTNGYDQRLSQGQPTVKRIELHADFLAGYFLGRRRKQGLATSLDSVGKTIERMGDDAIWNPNHHGTSSERITAAEAGFRVGFDRRNIDVGNAAQFGEQFVVDNL